MSRTKLSDGRPPANAMVYVWSNGELLVPRTMRSVWYGARYPEQEFADGETYYETHGSMEWAYPSDSGPGAAVLKVSR